MLVMNRFRIWGNKHTNCGLPACVSKKLYVWAAGKKY